jgi:mersacidin/lichenicidin family type 2 lantibiotic
MMTEHDRKDLNEQALPETPARREKDEISDEELAKVSGGAIGYQPPPTKKPGPQ